MLATNLAETRTILPNISWQTFRLMLAEMGGERNFRLAYEHGIVEIMTPLMPHENSNRIIEGFVLVLCEEFAFEVKSSGSLTLTRDDLEIGCEPDSSYYIQNEALIRGKDNIDLAFDPPPDIVLEVEYSKPKINKFILYAAMGIGEFWRYNGTTFRIYILQKGQYTETENSPTFPGIAIKEIPRFIQESRNIGQLAAKHVFRDWVRQQLFKSQD
ncbi:Uma2 family endonuclease [Calothrix sp. NIES-3974]|uniref:Uma2 family endonuclease n=1 Tax=Calothrix sp. NIES-3974 TaxID=2005462 RepID=UPI000B5E464B|nr:Uma2 family endonuclease [Calothrix sp. NIES-3974]BAZ05895.1 hypothetical protein NIES3974_25510 [Calothrix sp. NIES-3974]